MTISQKRFKRNFSVPAERFFLDQPFKSHEKIFLEGEEAEHLRVMRIKPNDVIEIVNGQGSLAKAKILDVHKNRIEALLIEVSSWPPKKDLLTLCIGIPRMNRLEWIIEKGTELGVGAFWLFPGNFSEKSDFSENQKQRLRNLSIAALKQCGRLDLPAFEYKSPLATWKKPAGTLLFGDTDPKAPLISPPYPKPILFFSGPEKGFSEKEVHLLREWHAKGVSLNPHILRSDTAPIAAAVLLGI